jgi:hypothetical protein
MIAKFFQQKKYQYYFCVVVAVWFLTQFLR